MSVVEKWKNAVEKAKKREQEKVEGIKSGRKTIMNDTIYEDAKSKPKIDVADRLVESEGSEEDSSSSEEEFSDDEDEVVEWVDANGRNDQLWSNLRF